MKQQAPVIALIIVATPMYSQNEIDELVQEISLKMKIQCVLLALWTNI